MKLSVLLQDYLRIPFAIDGGITGLTLDSRTVKPGDGFFACQGTQQDGRQYMEMAIQQGAKAIIAEGQTGIEMRQAIPVIYLPHLAKKVGKLAAIFYDHPSQKLKVIGVTGTNGKTSCTHFIASCLQRLHHPTGVIGTLGNGLFGAIQPAVLTTPDPVALQQQLAALLKQGATHVAMEVSSHSLDQGRINAIQFAAAVFTNLTRDHMDYHGTMENYGAAKKKLFTDYHATLRVINHDDDFGKKMLAELVGTDAIFSYGLEKFSGKFPTVYADAIHVDSRGMRAQVVTPWGAGLLQTQLTAKFNVSNILAVLTTLCGLDIPLKTVLEALSLIEPVAGRMQTLRRESQPLVVIDYAHTPDALENVLAALRKQCQGRLFCMFGCGGDRDRGKRSMMAAIAEQYADRVIVTDDNPRTENSEQIFTDIKQGFHDMSKVVFEHDRKKAIQEAISEASAMDCILIAGKGAETYQIIGEQKYPFSDELVAGSCLSLGSSLQS